MDVLQIVTRLEQAGGELSLKDGRIEYAIPRGNQEAQELLAELREHRKTLADFLRQRVHEHPVKWPPESMTRCGDSGSRTRGSSRLSGARFGHRLVPAA